MAINLKMSGIGAEPKKLAFLGVALAIAAYFYFTAAHPGGSAGGSAATPSPSRPATAAPSPIARVSPKVSSKERPGQRGGAGIQDFRPSLKPKKDGELDRASIDPTLKLDLLEKLRSVQLEGGTRSLFESGSSAGPALAVALNVREPKKIVPKSIYPVGPMPPPKPVPAPEPVAPPIPLKFYGFVTPKGSDVKLSGPKRAFFLDGEDIIVASEGQMVKGRYRIVRIGVNSAIVEDTQFKNHQQTLPLIEEQQG